MFRCTSLSHLASTSSQQQIDLNEESALDQPNLWQEQLQGSLRHPPLDLSVAGPSHDAGPSVSTSDRSDAARRSTVSTTLVCDI